MLYLVYADGVLGQSRKVDVLLAPRPLEDGPLQCPATWRRGGGEGGQPRNGVRQYSGKAASPPQKGIVWQLSIKATLCVVPCNSLQRTRGAGADGVLVRIALKHTQLAPRARVKDVEAHRDAVARVRGLLAGVGHQVLLIGAVVDQPQVGVSKALQALPLGAAPRRRALPVHRGDVVAQGRPLDKALRPELALVHLRI